MATVGQKLIAAFEAARIINDALWHSAIDPVYMSIDELHEHVQSAFGVKIEIRLVDVETAAVFGLIERYDEGKTAIVYLVKNIVPRFKRVVTAKELCHVVLDIEEDFSVDGLDTLQRLASPVIDIDAEENRSLRSEHVAEIVAWELLYPHELRAKDVADLKANRATISTLATRYKMPEVIVSEILAVPYLSMCDKYWKIVHGAHQARVLKERRGA